MNLTLGLPNGSMQEPTLDLLSRIGLDIRPHGRTISSLSDCAYAIETVVPKARTTDLLIQLRTLGATDIIVQNLNAMIAVSNERSAVSFFGVVEGADC